MKKKHVEHWDDERGDGNGIIVTIHYGWSFEPNEHLGVKGFDTPREAWSSSVFKCACEECGRHQ